MLEYLFSAMYSVMGERSSFENAKQLNAIFSKVSKMSSKFTKLYIRTNIFTYSSKEMIIGICWGFFCCCCCTSGVGFWVFASLLVFSFLCVVAVV